MLVALFVFGFNFAHAQFYKSLLPSPEFSSALEKIVLDFRLNFKTIQGQSIDKQGEADIFESAAKLPGVSECLIYQYHSDLDTTASWQGIVYKGDDYKEAAKAYENIFKLVKKSQIRWIDKSIVGFGGEMQKPTEELRFTVSTLNFLLDDPRYDKFEAEVEMLTTFNGYEVHLNLQTKKPDNVGASSGY